MFSLIFFGIIGALIVYAISIFNRLVALRNRFQNAFAQIDVQLKRRYDLIPNLVEVAKKYLEHERGTLEAVIKARNEAASSLQNAERNPGDEAAMQQLANAEQNLRSSMGRFNVTVEAYPELKGNENMMQLTEELTSTENKVSFARQGYNDTVMDYNTLRQSFPANIIANLFGHNKDAGLLQFDDRAEIQQAPKVSF